MLLSDRVAIVTGGARGIGKGIALKFAEEGCSITIADVLEEVAEKTIQEISGMRRHALFVKCDVSNSTQVQEMVEQTISKFGKVDILVNNAGIGALPKPFTETSEEEWDRVLAVDLKGVFLCSKAIAPHMKQNAYGRIINVSSLSAVTPSVPMIHYSAAKAGVLGLTRDMAIELAPFNICVNAILPGIVPTELTYSVMPPGPEREKLISQLGKAVVPMQRVGTPEDIAGVALFLASDLSKYVTGDRIYAGGGVPLGYLPTSPSSGE